jgi:hypothetical protein
MTEKEIESEAGKIFHNPAPPFSNDAIEDMKALSGMKLEDVEALTEAAAILSDFLAFNEVSDTKKLRRRGGKK